MGFIACAVLLFLAQKEPRPENLSKRKGASRGRKLRPAQALPTPATRHQQTPFERERSTKRRGEISELAFALAAARHGFGIARPYGDSERYDIILDPLASRPFACRSVSRTAAPDPRPGQIDRPHAARNASGGN